MTIKIKVFCIFVMISIFVIFGVKLVLSQEKRMGQEGIVRDDIGKTVMELQRLIRQKKLEGIDISAAIELNRLSINAMERGNSQECLKLLRQAIALLEESQEEDQYTQEYQSKTPFFLSAFQNSPFGIIAVRLNNSKDIEAIIDLGVKAMRPAAGAGNLGWEFIERSRGKYDWTLSDRFISKANELKLDYFATIGIKHDKLEGAGKGPAKLPKHIDWYLEWLEKAIERYDGDGIDDAPGSPVIHAVQIWNEPDGPGFWEDTPENYALLLKESYKVIKQASPEMPVAIGGAAEPAGYYRFFKSVLKELERIKDNPGDQYFDIFDIHWSGQSRGDNDYATLDLPDKQYELREYVSDIRNDLKSMGYKNVKIYCTEMSDYSDNPRSHRGAIITSSHTEKYHASQVIKRFIYSLSCGIEKIYWYEIIEGYTSGEQENGYFSNVGLINNPKNPDGFNHKKLAYYSYKLMVEKLEGSDWNNIETVRETDGIHIYKFFKHGKSIWVAWDDKSNETRYIKDSYGRQITISGINSKQVRIIEAIPNAESGANFDENNYPDFFTTETKMPLNGEMTIILGENPVFIEEQ